MMSTLPDVSAVWGVHDVRMYNMSDTVVISGEYVCCSVVTLWLGGWCLVFCGLSC